MKTRFSRMTLAIALIGVPYMVLADDSSVTTELSEIVVEGKRADSHAFSKETIKVDSNAVNLKGAMTDVMGGGRGCGHTGGSPGK